MDNDLRKALPSNKGFLLTITAEDTGNWYTVCIEQEIGRGAGCIVYRGRLQNPSVKNKAVIIKEFYPKKFENSIIREDDLKFKIKDSMDQDAFDKRLTNFREGHIQHIIFANNNPGCALPSVFHIGKALGTLYALSDIANGETLSAVKRDKYTITDALRLCASLCDAIHAIHIDSLKLYLDCKPDNIYVIDNKAYLFDFDTVQYKGKLKYSSFSVGWSAPEQVFDGNDGYRNPTKIGFQTDIFSIGAVFFYLLTGRKPSSDDLDKIKSEFDWHSSISLKQSENALNYDRFKDELTRIMQAMLEPNADKRKENFGNRDAAIKAKNDFLHLCNLAENAPYQKGFEDTHEIIIQAKNEILDSISNKFDEKKTARPILPTSKNRFKYNSNSTLFRGRDFEIEVLLNMCYAQDSFLWMGICGQGGAGKSRLAYEVCARMIEQDWDVFAPLHFSANREMLRDAVFHPQRDVLICLDYVKQDIDAIEIFIRSIIENPYHLDYKIRILLIEREKQDVIIDSLDIEQYKYCAEISSHYYDGLIELQPMEENIIRYIIVDYIVGQTTTDCISPDAIDLIMDTLESVDCKSKRPLYALFIADAWLNDEELRKWDRKNALEYLLRRERERLASIIADPQFNLNIIQQENYRSTVEYLYAFATYSGEIRIDEYSDIINRNYGLTASDDMLLAILSVYGIISPEKEINGWEPDLIGEYFCVDYFNRSKTEDVESFINLLIDKDISAFIRFSENIYKDYLDIICESGWLDLLRNINYPQKYNYVRRKQFAGNKFLQNINFEGRIVTIQKSAFEECVNLEKIIFPSSLEIIEPNAFLGCTRLTEATTEDGKGKEPSIISIENHAFKDCGALEDIILPDSLQTLGTSVFENCYSLKCIEIPQKVKKIGNSSFAGCKSLEKVIMRAPKNITLGDSCFYDCTSLVEVTGSKNIAAIENGAFRDCSKLEGISLSNSLRVFNDNVFSGCHSLKSIDLSQCDIDMLPVRTFYECTSLDSVVLPESIISIGDKAFYACKNIEILHIPEKLETIGLHAFGECKKLKSLRFPQVLKSIGGYAFKNCEELSEIIFSRSIQRIGVNAFSGCRNLSLSNANGLLSPETKELCGFVFKSIDDEEFDFLKKYANQKEIIIPNSVIKIGDNTFKGLSELVSIVLPSDVQSIGSNAFRDCTSLKTVKCNNDSIIFIGSCAFSECKSLESITGRLKLSEIEDNTFSNCVSLRRVEFSTQVNSIGRSAFGGCSKLKVVFQKRRIPKYIGTGAFEGCSRTLYPVNVGYMRKHKLSPRKFCFDGFVFNSIGDKEFLFLKKYSQYEDLYIPKTCIDLTRVQFSRLKKMKKLVIPSSIKSLVPGMFKGCTSLEEIELPNTIKEIPSNVFEGCKALKSICFTGVEKNKIPSGVRIGEAAFLKCSSLSNIELPIGLTTIKRFTFSCCDGLSEIVIPDTVGGIGKNAFAWCKNLKRVVLPQKLKYMGKNAFKGCISLLRVDNLENTMLTELQNNMFESCVALETIVLPQNLQIIKGSAFKDCRHLEVPKCFIPTSTTKIEAAAFQGCFNIESIRVPRKITIIEDYTFKSCSSLREVVLSNNIKHIGQSAFYHCNSLCSDDFKLPERLETIGTSALSHCSSLSELAIPQTIHTLPSGLFKGCAALKTVELPDGIKEIPTDCFKDCSSLKGVLLPDSVRIINVGAFRNCTALTPDKRFLPNELQEIRESAFRYCDSLTNVFIPHNVKRLSPAVFEGCVNLKSVEFTHIISDVGNYAFSHCTSLEEFPFSLVDMRIGDAAFINCKALKTPRFSEAIKTISSAAFRGCSGIETFVFPRSTKRISGAVLREAFSLKKVVIPEGVTVIKKSAFRDCVKLTNVEIKSPQIRIESRAFKGCVKLDFIEIPEKSNVQPDAFEDCPAEIELIEADIDSWLQEHEGNKQDDFLYEEDSNNDGLVLKKYIGSAIEKVVIPQEINGKLVIGIGDSCFEENYKLKEIILPDTIKTIGENAFAYCKNLSDINIPEGIVRIGMYAFRDCHNLETIILSNSIEVLEEGTFAYCWKLKQVSIPSTLSRINKKAFLSCVELKLSIPDSVTTIESGAFARCNRDMIQCEHTNIDDAWFE